MNTQPTIPFKIILFVIFLLNWSPQSLARNCDSREGVKAGEKAKFHTCWSSKFKVDVEVPQPDGASAFANVTPCSNANMLMSLQVVCENGDIVQRNANDTRSKDTLCIFRQLKCMVVCSNGERIHKPTKMPRKTACDRHAEKQARENSRKPRSPRKPLPSQRPNPLTPDYTIVR